MPPGNEAAEGEVTAVDEPLEAEADGRAFEVSDHRGSITADHRGIRFRLDDEEADFHWAEIGAVEIDTPRFGRQFTVTVHMTSRHTYETDVEAPARSLLKEWTAELDAVLDIHFEDGAPQGLSETD
jgi:hypothetical protein